MVTKEECDALRKHLSILDDCPLPWSSDGDFQGEIECDNGYIVTTCEQDDEAEFIAAVVNVFPALLDALEDAARALATAREDASEMEKKAIAEGGEALALKAEVVALKAATQWRKMEDAPRDGSAIFAMHETGRVYQVTYQQRAGDDVWEDLDGVCRDTEDFLCWLPIPEIVGIAQ